jgi:hypothetical protein
MKFNQATVQSLYTYDPNEPLAFRWRQPQKMGRAVIGEIAGHWHPVHAGSAILKRYIQIGRHDRVPLHHAVWVYHHGTEPPKNFGPSRDRPDDYRIENLVLNPRRRPPETLKSVRAAYQRKWRDSFTDEAWAARSRKRYLNKRYDISDSLYEKLLKAQDGACAICKRPETMIRNVKGKDRPEKLSVDHCHTTGLNRGLLCSNCNNGLGRFGDDPLRLRAAADYLECHVTPSSSPNGHGYRKAEPT